MKKVSTVAAKQSRNFSQPKLTIGLDLGDRSSWYCVLDEAGAIVAGAETGHDSESDEGSVRGDAAQPDRAGNRDALALGKPGTERVGARSDRGACPQCALDRREPKERRSAGCADVGSAGQDRSAVAVSGEASQRESAGGSDRDPGASRVGAGTNGAGEHGPRTGQVLWRAAARVQRAQYESGESPGAESGTANRTGAVAGGNRVAE